MCFRLIYSLSDPHNMAFITITILRYITHAAFIWFRFNVQDLVASSGELVEDNKLNTPHLTIPYRDS